MECVKNKFHSRFTLPGFAYLLELFHDPEELFPFLVG
jgi:hypothetical protein